MDGRVYGHMTTSNCRNFPEALITKVLTHGAPLRALHPRESSASTGNHTCSSFAPKLTSFAIVDKWLVISVSRKVKEGMHYYVPFLCLRQLLFSFLATKVSLTEVINFQLLHAQSNTYTWKLFLLYLAFLHSGHGSPIYIKCQHVICQHVNSNKPMPQKQLRGVGVV